MHNDDKIEEKNREMCQILKEVSNCVWCQILSIIIQLITVAIICVLQTTCNHDETLQKLHFYDVRQ